ncbi:MAG TPA: glycoside hydrolase family 2 TIM barrel-domain containing protein [Solirubrobacteraceae bacterium]
MAFPPTSRAAIALVAALALIILAPPAAATTFSDVGPAGWSTGTGDPNLGVLNQGARTLNFDDGWRFKLVNTANTSDPTGLYGNSSNPLASARGFDDSSWPQLMLPHDWSITLDPQPDQSNATGFFPGGLGWYRKTFTLPRSMAGKRLSIDFDGVFENSYVYVNGRLVGNHPYGYTGYSYDVTGLVHTDGRTPNVIAVVVQNLEPSSRWYSGSGITRHVHLTVVDPVHIARWGTSVTTPHLATTIRAGYATAHVSTDLANDSDAGATVSLRYTIADARGRVVARGNSAPTAVGRNGSTPVSDLRISHPTLWSTTNPHLYTLTTDVIRDGRTVDSGTVSFGVRWLTFDPDRGIFLNGQHLKIKGVDLHNDEGALGSVDNYDAMWRQMSNLKAMGVNAFRTSHNPPSPELIDICQRLGIVMMVEAFDAWDTGKLSADYHLYFNQWSDYDIKEMVDEAKNSPAVIMWSIGNEIPDWTSSNALPIEQRLIGDIRSIDTTRPIVAGSDRYRGVPAPGSVADQMLRNLDGLGVNYDTAKAIDGLHAQYPTKFFFASESSSETSTRGYYQDPTLLNTGQNFTPGKEELSSYDNNLDDWTLSGDYSLKVDRDRPFFAGQFVWSGWDYIGEPTPYSTFPVKTSFFGLVDTAGFNKDQYYLFKSQWNPAPMVHILPMNWTDYKPGQPVEVWTYANAPTVELFLNGVSLGAKSFTRKTTTSGQRYLETSECPGDDKNYAEGACPGSYESPNGSSGKLHLAWTVPFQPGRLVAVARDASGRVVARDEVDTAGAPDRLRLTTDRTRLLADGKSLAYVTVHVVDAHGVQVPDADNTVHVSVGGAGTFQGADNGKEDDAEGYKSTTHDAFNGLMLAIVQAGTRPGSLDVSVTSPGLRGATMTLHPSRSAHGPASRAVSTQLSRSPATPPQSSAAPTADASFTGGVFSGFGSDFGVSTTLPATVLDGDPSTYWSNRYSKVATQTLNGVTNARPDDWVSVTWAPAKQVSSLQARFILDANDELPANATVYYRNGSAWTPVSNQHVVLATGSNAPSTITFDPVTTTALKLEMTSAAPYDPVTGNLAISELRIPGVD